MMSSSNVEADQWPSHLVPIMAVPMSLANSGGTATSPSPPLAQHPQVVQHLTTPPSYVLDLKQLLQFTVLLIYPAPVPRPTQTQPPQRLTATSTGGTSPNTLQDSIFGHAPNPSGSEHPTDSVPPSIAVDTLDEGTVPPVMPNIPSPSVALGASTPQASHIPTSNTSFGGVTPLLTSLNAATPNTQPLTPAQSPLKANAALRYKLSTDPIAAINLIGANLRFKDQGTGETVDPPTIVGDVATITIPKGGPAVAELRIPNHPSVYILHLPPAQMLIANGALHSASAVSGFWAHIASLKHYITVANRYVDARPMQPMLLRMRMDFASGGGAALDGLSHIMLERELQNIRSSFATGGGNVSSTPPPQRNDAALLDRCHKSERETRRRFAAERRRLNRQNCQGLSSITVSLSTHTRKCKRRPAARISGTIDGTRNSATSPRRGSSKGMPQNSNNVPRPPNSPLKGKRPNGRASKGSLGIDELQKTFEPEEEDDLSMDDIQSSSEEEERRASLTGAGDKGVKDYSASRKEKRLAAKKAVKDRERMFLDAGEALDLNRGTVSVTSQFDSGQKKTGCSVALAFTVASSSQLNLSFEMDHSTLGRLVTYRKFRPLLAMPETFLPNQRRGSTPMGHTGATGLTSQSSVNLSPRAGESGLPPPSSSKPSSGAAASQGRVVDTKEGQKLLQTEARYLYEDVAKEEWWARLAPYNTITIAELLARHKSRQSAAIIELVSAASLPMQLQLAENYRFGPNHRLPDPPAVKGRVEIWVEPLPTAFELFHFSAVGLVRKAGQVGVVTYADPILRLQLKAPTHTASIIDDAPPPTLRTRNPSVASTSIAGLGKSTLGKSIALSTNAGATASMSASTLPSVAPPQPNNSINDQSLYLSEGYRNTHAAAFLPIPIAHAPSAMLDEREHFIDLSTAATSLINRLTSVVPSNLSSSVTGGGPVTNFRPDSMQAEEESRPFSGGGQTPRGRMMSTGGRSKSLGQALGRTDGVISRLVMCSTVLAADILPPIPVLKLEDGNESNARPSGDSASQRNFQRQRLSTIGGPPSPSQRPSPPSPTRRSQSAPGLTSSFPSSLSELMDRKVRTMPRSSLLASTVTITQSSLGGQSSPSPTNRRAQSAPNAPTGYASPLPIAAAVPILTCTAPMRTSMLNVQVVDGIRHCALQLASAVAEATRGANPPSPTNPMSSSPTSSPSSKGRASSAKGGTVNGGLRSPSPTSTSASALASLPTGGSAPIGGVRVAPTPNTFKDDGTVCPVLLGSTEVSLVDLASRSQMAYERSNGYGGAPTGSSSSVPLASLLMITSVGHEEPPTTEEARPIRNNEATMPPSVAQTAPQQPATTTPSPAPTTSVGVLITPLKRNHAFDSQIISEYDQMRQRREVYPEVGSDCYPDFPPPAHRKVLASKALLTSYITEGRVLSTKLSATSASRGEGGAIASGSGVGDGSVEARRQASMAVAQQQQTLIPLASGSASGMGASNGGSPKAGAPVRTRGKGFSTFSAMAKKNQNQNPNLVDGPYAALLANTEGDKVGQNAIVPASYRVAPSVTIMHLQHQRILRGLPVPCSRHNFSLLEFLRSPKNGIEFHAVTAIDYGTKLFYKRKVRRYLDLSCYPSVNNSKDLEDIIDPLPYIDYEVSFCRVSKRAQLLHSEAPPVDLSAGGSSGPMPTFPNGWSAMDGIMAVVQRMLEPIAFRNAKSHSDKSIRGAYGTSETHNASPFGPSRVVHRWREGKKIAVNKPPMPPGDLIAFYHETHLAQECEDEGDEVAEQDGVAFSSLDTGSAGKGRRGLHSDNASNYSGLNNAEGAEPIIRRLYVSSTKGTTKVAIHPLSVDSNLNSIVLPPNADAITGGYEPTTARGALLYQALSGKFGTSRFGAPPPAPGRMVKADIPATVMIDQSQLPTSLEAFNKKWFSDAKHHYRGTAVTDIAAAKAQMYGTGRTWLRKGTSKANALESVMAEKEKAILLTEAEILDAYCLRPKETISPAALTSATALSASTALDRRRSRPIPPLGDIFGAKSSPKKEFRRSYYSGSDDENGPVDDGDAFAPVEVIYDEDYSYPYRYRLVLPAAKEQIRREEERAFLESMGRSQHGGEEANAMSISSRPGSARGGVSTSSHSGATPVHLMIQHMLEMPLGITSPLQLRLTETAEDLVNDLKDKYQSRESQRQHHARTQYRRALLLQPPSPIVDVLKGIVERCKAKQLAREELFAKELAARAEVDEENDDEEWSEDEAEIATAEAQRRRQKDGVVTSANQSPSVTPTTSHLIQESSPQDIPIAKPPTIAMSYFDHIPSSELIMNPREQRRAFQHEGRPGRHPDNRPTKSHVRHECKAPVIHHVATIVVCHPMQRSNSSHGGAAEANERKACDLESVLAYLASVAHLPINFVFIFVNCEAPMELMSFPNVLTSDFYTLAAEMLREVPQGDRNTSFFETVVVKPETSNLAATSAKAPSPALPPSSQRPSQVDSFAAGVGQQARPPSSGNTSRSGQRVTFSTQSPTQSAAVEDVAPELSQDKSLDNAATKSVPFLATLTAEEVAKQEQQRSDLLALHASMRSLHKTFDNISSVAVNYCRVRYRDDQLPYDALDSLYDPNELMESAEMQQEEQYELARQREMELQMAAAIEAVAESTRRGRGGNGTVGEGSFSYQGSDQHIDGDPSVELMSAHSPIEGSKTSADRHRVLHLRRGTSLADEPRLIEEEDGDVVNEGEEHMVPDESQLPLDERQSQPSYPSGASCFEQMDTWRYTNGDPSANRREYLKASETFHEAMEGAVQEDLYQGYMPRPPFPSTLVPPSLRPDNTQGSGSEQQRRLMVLQSLTPKALKRSITPPLAAGGHVQGQALMSRYISDDDEEEEGGAESRRGSQQRSRSTTPNGTPSRIGVQKATLTVLDVFMDSTELQKHQKHATHVSQLLTGTGGATAGVSAKDPKNSPRRGGNNKSSALKSRLSPTRRQGADSFGKGPSGRESPTAQTTTGTTQSQLKELMLLEETVLRRKLQQLQQRDDVWVALDTPSQQRPAEVAHTNEAHPQPRTVVTVKIDPKFRDLVLEDDDDANVDITGNTGKGSAASNAQPLRSGTHKGGASLEKSINIKVNQGGAKVATALLPKGGKPVGSGQTLAHDKGVEGGALTTSSNAKGNMNVIGGRFSHDDRYTVYKVQVDSAPMTSPLFTTNNKLSDIQKANNRYAQLARTPTLASAASANSPRRGIDASINNRDSARPATSGPAPPSTSPRKTSTAGNALLGLASTAKSKKTSRPSSSSPRARNASAERRPSSGRSLAGGSGSARSHGKGKKHTVDEMLYTSDGSVSLQGLPPAKAKQLRAMLRSENAVYGGPKMDMRQLRAQEDQMDLLAATRGSTNIGAGSVRIISPQDQQAPQQQLPSIFQK